jgi:uncharacterized membrane protein YgcG
MHHRSITASTLCLFTVFALLAATAVGAQDAEAPPPLKPEEIEQLVAPIALYPDSLLAQVLMASTYPLEVVEAARWVKANPKVTGDALEQAMQKQSWDASVKSLTAFPQVIKMMDEKLDWTQKLGDAFLAQQKDVMDTVQRLRAKAQAEGNLETNKEQKVVVEQAPASQTTIIQIEPADPQVVYVPTYNPTVVYGAWPYPAYPPYSYYPPGYVAATSLISFGVGMAVGSALWGDCNWGGGDVDINVNNYNNFNKTNIQNNKWEHNASHRKGVEYRDQASRDRYKGSSAKASQSRDAFRGRAEQGRQSLPQQKDLAKAGGGRDRPGGAGQDRVAGKDRPAGGGRVDRPADRPRHEGLGQGRNPSAFKDVGNGREVRQASERGHQSRQQSAQKFGSGGGGGRAGGGGRGGGGGGGRRGR